MTTTTTSTLAPAKGVSLRSAWKLVRKSDPGLVTTWRAALEACVRNDPAWSRRNNVYQRDRGIPRRRVTSSYGKAPDLPATERAPEIDMPPGYCRQAGLS